MKHLLTALALTLLLFPLWGCSSAVEEEPPVFTPKSALWSGVSGRLEGLDWDEGVILFASPEFANSVWFHLDRHFPQLGFTYVPDETPPPMRRRDLLPIEEFTLYPSYGMDDLHHLPNLKELHLSYSREDPPGGVDFAPLAQLTGLRSLIITNTLIDDLSFVQNLPALEELTLHNNSLSNLSPLAQCPWLQSLDLQDNDIADLQPLAGLTGLRKLDLRENNIEDISPLAELTGLEKLNLSYNDIQNLSPLEGLTGLHTLSLGDNQIEDVSPLAGLSNLHTLWLDYNQIEDVTPLAGLGELKTISLNRNLIVDFSPLLGLEKLETANLWNNRISTGLEGASYAQLLPFSLGENPLDYAPLAGEILLPENLRDTSESGRFGLYTLGQETFVADSETGRITPADYAKAFHRDLLYIGNAYLDPATGESFPLEFDLTATAMMDPGISEPVPRSGRGSAYHKELDQWICLSESLDGRFWVDYYTQFGEHLRSVETPFIQAYYPNFGSYEPEHNEFHLWGDWLVFYDFTIYGQRWPHQEVVAYNVRNNTWWYPQADFIRAVDDRLVLAAYAYDEWENQYIQADLYCGTQLVCSLWAPLGGRGRITEGSRYMTYDYNKNIFTFSGIELNFADALEKQQTKEAPRHAE